MIDEIERFNAGLKKYIQFLERQAAIRAAMGNMIAETQQSMDGVMSVPNERVRQSTLRLEEQLKEDLDSVFARSEIAQLLALLEHRTMLLRAWLEQVKA